MNDCRKLVDTQFPECLLSKDKYVKEAGGRLNERLKSEAKMSNWSLKYSDFEDEQDTGLKVSTVNL